MTLKIAITGANGFIGQHVIAKALSLNADIHVYTRKDYGLPGTYHHWDALEPTDIIEDSGYDAIIHCAASTSEKGKEVYDVNVNGTIRALAIDSKARFIHVSSASVYGHTKHSNGLKIEEDEAGLGRLFNDYSRGKWKAERIVQEEKRAKGAIILRPQAVYGPGDTTLLPRLEGCAKKGKLILPNGGEALLSVTRVESFVDVIFDVIMSTNPVLENSIQTYNVADHSPSPLWHTINEISDQRTPMRIVSAPLSVSWIVAFLSEKTYNFFRSKKEPRVTRYLVGHLGYNSTLNLERIENLLDREMSESNFNDASTW